MMPSFFRKALRFFILLSLLFISSCQEYELPPIENIKENKDFHSGISKRSSLIMHKENTIILDSLFDKEPNSYYSKERFYKSPGLNSEKRISFLENSEVLKYHDFKNFFKERLIGLKQYPIYNIDDYINFSNYVDYLDNDYVYRTIIESYIKDLEYFNGLSNANFIRFLRNSLDISSLEERNKIYQIAMTYSGHNYMRFLEDEEIPSRYFAINNFIEKYNLENEYVILSILYTDSLDIELLKSNYENLEAENKTEITDSNSLKEFIKKQIILDSQAYLLNENTPIEQSFIKVYDPEISFEEQRENNIALLENMGLDSMIDTFESLANPYSGMNQYSSLGNNSKMRYNSVVKNEFGTLYKMNDGSVIINTYQSVVSDEDSFLNNLYPSTKGRWYIKNTEFGQWENLILPPDNPEEVLFKIISSLDTLGKGIYRYVLPVEDILIVIKGKDLDSNTVTKLERQIAMGYLPLSVMPVGNASKLFKPFFKITKNSKILRVTSKLEIQLVKKIFGHTFTTHGEEMTHFLINRARGSGSPQGQFLDNQKAAEFILENIKHTSKGAINIPIPKGFPARVIMPDGLFKSATHIRLVPSGNGVKTAYPLFL